MLNIQAAMSVMQLLLLESNFSLDIEKYRYLPKTNPPLIFSIHQDYHELDLINIFLYQPIGSAPRQLPKSIHPWTPYIAITFKTIMPFIDPSLFQILSLLRLCSGI